MYWHNKMSDWKATEDEAKLTNVVRKITPIKRGSHFHAKVRFQNLSELELGALLTVFDLAGAGETAAYKLGQGKSLGLGSVKMKQRSISMRQISIRRCSRMVLLLSRHQNRMTVNTSRHLRHISARTA